MITLLWLLLWALAIGAVVRLLTGLWTRLWRVRRLADQVHYATTVDGWSLALHRYLPETPRFEEPVILCHGMGTNRFNFDLAADRSLARTLARRGFDVWSLELRGHGQSTRPGWFSGFDWGFDFDVHLDRDAPAALELVRRETGQARVFWLGHSMGGLIGYGLLGRPDHDDLAGLVAIASPVWLDRSAGVRRFRMLARVLTIWRAVFYRPLARFMSPFLGNAPGFMVKPFYHPGAMEPLMVRRALVNLVENSSAALLKQFVEWLRERRFGSRDGEIDYLGRLEQATKPVLLVAAERDLIASPESVTPAYERIRTRDKQFRIFGTDAGDDHDFGHGDILLGQAAASVVFPEIVDWLVGHATGQGQALADQDSGEDRPRELDPNSEAASGG